MLTDWICIEKNTDFIKMEFEEAIEQFKNNASAVMEDEVEEYPMNLDGDDYEPLNYFYKLRQYF